MTDETRNPAGLEQTWRWFGPKDPISLVEIKQAGATGIVTALHQVPIGEVWTVDAILERKATIEAAGLTWSVSESVPVHEDIKRRSGPWRARIEAYKESVRNLGQCGVGIVCYNFMPLLDWLRTDLRVVFRDGSITTKFESDLFAVFDIFILKRPGAEEATEQIERVRARHRMMTAAQKDALTETVLLGFPGSLEAYTLEGLRSALRLYEGIGDRELRENLGDFLREVVPAAEESGVAMAIHPDDPPWPVLGLPRVVTDSADVEFILSAADSPANGLTFCTGSFGAKHANDLVRMARQFAPRTRFVHLRNVSRNEQGDFLEENHLDGDVDMHGVMREMVLEQIRRTEAGMPGSRMPFRPDHGHLMQPDMHRKGMYPGYSLFGRMRGLAELRGLELGIRKSLGP
jgi:mannonate dehydratase